MSVLPLEADIHQGDGYVSFVPIAEVNAAYFNMTECRAWTKNWAHLARRAWGGGLL